jgi:hypothetical protein
MDNGRGVVFVAIHVARCCRARIATVSPVVGFHGEGPSSKQQSTGMRIVNCAQACATYALVTRTAAGKRERRGSYM